MPQRYSYAAGDLASKGSTATIGAENLMNLDGRVGALERETARHGEQLNQLRNDVREVGTGVNRLIEIEGQRPTALTSKQIGATIISVCAMGSMLAAFTWWMIANSPSVRSIEDRVTDLDHPTRGRVKQLELDAERRANWRTSITRP
jgi:hypothetical protein